MMKKRGRPSLTGELRQRLDRMARSYHFARSILPGENQLATLLGVSRTPVRRLLAQLAEEGKLFRCASGQYILVHYPMGEVETPTAVYLTDWVDAGLQRPHFPGNIYGGLQTGFQQAGWRLLTLFGLRELKPDYLLSWFPFPHVKGIVISHYLAEADWNREALYALRKLNIPLVIPSSLPELNEFHRVVADQYQGGRLLASYLKQQNVKHVLCIAFGDSSELPYWYHERKRGLEEGLRPDGAGAGQPTLHFHESKPPFSDYNPKNVESCGEIMSWLTGELQHYFERGQWPDAVLVPSDGHVRLIRRCFEQLKPRHSTPLICGFDNYWEDLLLADGDPMHRPDCTIDTCPDIIGQRVAEMIVRLQRYPHHPVPGQLETVLPRLVIPSSCD